MIQVHRTIRVDGRQNGRLGIAQVLVATGLAEGLEAAVGMLLAGEVYAICEGRGRCLDDPTAYPDLLVISTLCSVDPKTLLIRDSVSFELTQPCRVIIDPEAQ